MMKRRNFLKTAAAAGAGIGFPTIVPSIVFGANAPSNRVTLAQIGCGSRGRAVLSNIRRHAEIVAVCDPFRSRRDEFAQELNNGCTATGDFRDLMTRDDIDGVVIVTQDSWHVPMTLAACRAGKDVYCEKPLGLTIEENLACQQTVRRYNRVFQYGTQQRSMTHCRRACERVRNGRVGEIKQIDVVAPNSRVGGGSTTPLPTPEDLDYEMWLGPVPYSPYTSDRCSNAGSWFIYDNSLGFIGGWGAHPLDLAVWGTDFTKAGGFTVEGTGKIPTQGLFDCVYDWDLTYRFDNGLILTFRTGSDNTRFNGSDGWIDVSRRSAAASTPALLAQPLEAGDTPLPLSLDHGKDFVDAIRSRRDPVSHVDDAFQSDLFSQLGDICIRLGRKVRWDAHEQTIVGDDSARRMIRRAMREPWTL